jgi:transcriptional regulator MraZ
LWELWEMWSFNALGGIPQSTTCILRKDYATIRASRGRKWDKVVECRWSRRSGLKDYLEQMFFNRYTHSFDDKGRLTIPAKFRIFPEEGGFVIQGFDRNLMAMTADVFKLISNRLADISITDPNARLLRRVILGNAMPFTLDGAGRILLTPNLKEYAELKDDVVFVGAGDYFEIWSPELWKEQEAKVSDADTNNQRFAMIDVRTR